MDWSKVLYMYMKFIHKSDQKTFLYEHVHKTIHAILTLYVLTTYADLLRYAVFTDLGTLLIIILDSTFAKPIAFHLKFSD